MTARNTDLAEAVKNIGTGFEAFQKKHEAAMQSIEVTLAENRERLEELESRGSRPVNTNTARNSEHMKLFTAWLKKPHDGKARGELDNFQSDLERKDVSIGSLPGGGYSVPEEIVREIERIEMTFSPVRSLVKVIRISTSDAKQLVNTRGTDAGWVGEAGPRPETNTSQFREVVLPGGELYSYPKASEWVSQDSFVDVGAWLAKEVGQAFAKLEGAAVLTGTGSNQPSGIFKNAPTNRDDFDSPVRDNEIQYVQDGDSPYAIDADTLIDLYYKVNSAYRANGTWAMNSATAALVRKLKASGDGHYLWTDSLAAGQPATLLGRPVAIWEDMDSVDVSGGSNATFPILFGDFKRGYVLADRSDLRVTVDSNITSPGYIKYYVRKRVHGSLMNVDAIKALRSAA
jgi:HK97 family phage major capsid protein